jgi:hypothetical protein
MKIRLGVVLVFGACWSCSGGHESLESQCRERGSTLAPDEVTPLGITATELLTAGTRSWTVELRMLDRPVTSMSLATAGTGSKVLYVPMLFLDNSSDDVASFCPEHLETAVSLSARAADGAVDFTLPATLKAFPGSRLTVDQRIQVLGMGGFQESADLEGRFDLPAGALAGYERAVVETAIELPAGTGRFSLRREVKLSSDSRAEGPPVTLASW